MTTRTTTGSLAAAFRLLVPGLVIQAVMVGGGYATGRELVEFFISAGPATGVLGMVLTALLFSGVAMISFELARRFTAFDYRSFCRTYLGRGWVLFELGYVASLMLALSVVSAAAAELVAETTGLPPVAGHLVFVVGIALLVTAGNDIFERIISVWSIVFYGVYGLMFVLALIHFGDRMAAGLGARPMNLLGAVGSSISYSGYNIVLIPIMIFVARNFRSRREALTAGALAGPLILLPGAAFLLALTAFYPAVLDAPLPVQTVLAGLGAPLLSVAVQIIIFCALLKTGAGLLHGLNERVDGALVERGAVLPRWGRPALAVGAMFIAVVVASRVGLVDLIRNGYRFSSLYFTVVFVIPLLTVGLGRLLTRKSEKTAA